MAELELLEKPAVDVKPSKLKSLANWIFSFPSPTTIDESKIPSTTLKQSFTSSPNPNEDKDPKKFEPPSMGSWFELDTKKK